SSGLRRQRRAPCPAVDDSRPPRDGILTDDVVGLMLVSAAPSSMWPFARGCPAALGPQIHEPSGAPRGSARRNRQGRSLVGLWFGWGDAPAICGDLSHAQKQT